MKENKFTIVKITTNENTGKKVFDVISQSENAVDGFIRISEIEPTFEEFSNFEFGTTEDLIFAEQMTEVLNHVNPFPNVKYAVWQYWRVAYCEEPKNGELN